MNPDKFLQPDDAIVVVKRMTGRRTLLTDSDWRIVAERVAQGEDEDAVVDELQRAKMAAIRG